MLSPSSLRACSFNRSREVESGAGRDRGAASGRPARAAIETRRGLESARRTCSGRAREDAPWGRLTAVAHAAQGATFNRSRLALVRRADARRGVDGSHGDGDARRWRSVRTPVSTGAPATSSLLTTGLNRESAVAVCRATQTCQPHRCASDDTSSVDGEAGASDHESDSGSVSPRMDAIVRFRMACAFSSIGRSARPELEAAWRDDAPGRARSSAGAA